MLEERLTQASRKASEDRRKIWLVALALLVGATVLLSVATLLWSPADDRKAAVSPETEAVGQTAADDKGAANREAFKAALGDYEANLEPHVASEPFLKWDSEARHRIDAAKEKALSLFAVNDYAKARKELEAASSLARSALAAMATDFQSAIENARIRHAGDAYDEALIEITKALHIRPQDPTALALKADIDALPQVLKLIKDADVARLANDVEAELAHVRAIVSLAPERADYTERLHLLDGQIRERQFASAITRGMEQVENRDLKGAQGSLAAARRLFPGRQEASLLGERVQRLSEALKVGDLMAQATVAAGRDDWAHALGLYSEAARTDPSNRAVIEGSQMAQSIVDTRARIEALLQNAHRLGSPVAIAEAGAVLGQGAAYADRSPGLVDSMARLKEQLDAYGRKVPLLIRSDNQTEIVVRGVGKVGRTTEKIIEIKPGTYTFEGIRPGYKSRLTSVSVYPDQTGVVVEVVCDERL